MHFGDERAPLEMTKVSTQTITIACPECFTGRSVSINCVSVICSRCGNYFKVKDAKNVISTSTISTPLIDKDFIKTKAKMEKEAYDWRDKQIKLKKEGKMLSHEPRE